MVTVNYELRAEGANKKGSIPIYIRITKDREKKRVRFFVDATSDDVTASGEIKNMRLEMMLTDELQKYRHKIYDAGPAIETWSIDKVVEYLTGDERKAEFRLDFIQFGRELTAKLLAEGKISAKTAKCYGTALNTLVKFLDKESVDINDINKAMLLKMMDWFTANGYGSRAVELYMSNLATIHSRAKAKYNDEEDDKLNIRLSPFKYVEYQRTAAEKSMVKKRAISATALRYLYGLPAEGLKPGTVMARDAFLLSFGLCGMNAVDMYKHQQGDEKDVVEYYRSKIVAHSGEDAFIRMHIHPFYKPIHERLAGVRHTWYFAERYAHIDNLTHALNEGIRDAVEQCVFYYGAQWKMTDRKKILKRLELPEHLQFYAARHSFATIAANDCGVSEETVDRCQCHVRRSMAAKAYIKKDYRYTDDTIAKVTAFVFGE